MTAVTCHPRKPPPQTCSGKPGPPKANTPRVLASKTLAKRDTLARTQGVPKAAVPSMTRTRSEVLERRRAELHAEGSKFANTKEQSIHSHNLLVKNAGASRLPMGLVPLRMLVLMLLLIVGNGHGAGACH